MTGVAVEATDAVDRRRARSAVTSTFFLNGLVATAWVARIPQVKERLGLDDGTLGAVLLAGPVGIAIAVRFAGRLTARWRERTIALASGSVAALSPLLLGFAWSLPSLVAALLVFGGSMGLMDVAMNAQGVAVERAHARPLMSGFHAAFSLGAITGALSGSLAAALAVPVGAHLTIVAIAILALLWIAGRGPVVDSSASAPASTAPTPSRPSADARRLLARLGTIGFCAFVGEGAMADWSAVYLREALHAAPGVAGLGYAACAGFMTAARLAGDRVVARWGPSRVLRAGSCVAAAGLAGGLFIGAAPAAIAGFGLFGLGVAVVAPITFSAAGNVPGLPPATGLSHVTSIGYLGMLGGPPVIGFLAREVGLGAALLVPAGLAAMIALLAGTTARG